MIHHQWPIRRPYFGCHTLGSPGWAFVCSQGCEGTLSSASTVHGKDHLQGWTLRHCFWRDEGLAGDAPFLKIGNTSTSWHHWDYRYFWKHLKVSVSDRWCIQRDHTQAEMTRRFHPIIFLPRKGASRFVGKAWSRERMLQLAFFKFILGEACFNSVVNPLHVLYWCIR